MTKDEKECLLVGYYRRASDFAAAVKLDKKHSTEKTKASVKLLDAMKEEFRYYLYCVYDPDGDFIGGDITSDGLNAILDAVRAVDAEAERDVMTNSEKSYDDAAAFVASLGLKDDVAC